MIKTLQNLRDEVRNIADLHKDGDVISQNELDNYINTSNGELWDLLIQSDDARTFTVNATIPKPLGDHSFRLPFDFYRLVSVHVRKGSYYELARKADADEYAELAASHRLAQMGVPKYYIRWHPATGERFIFVFPKQDKPEDIAVTYYPQPPVLDTESSTMDSPADWLEFVVLTSAIKAYTKLERDATGLHLLKKEAAMRIKKAVTNLDLGQPNTIREARGTRRIPGTWVG